MNYSLVYHSCYDRGSDSGYRVYNSDDQYLSENTSMYSMVLANHPIKEDLYKIAIAMDNMKHQINTLQEQLDAAVYELNHGMEDYQRSLNPDYDDIMVVNTIDSDDLPF